MGKQLPLLEGEKHTDNQVVNEEKNRKGIELTVSNKYATMELKTEALSVILSLSLPLSLSLVKRVLDG